VLDGVDAPALLVEQRVAQHARQRQVRVFEWIGLEVLVAAVAIEQISEAWVPLPDRAEQAKRRRRALDVERVVVLDDANRRAQVVGLLGDDDAFPVAGETQRAGGGLGL
jgi:hypothetical protein